MANNISYISFEDGYPYGSEPLQYTGPSQGSVGAPIDTASLKEPYTPNSRRSTPGFPFPIDHDGLPETHFANAIQPLHYDYIQPEGRQFAFPQSMMSPSGEFDAAPYEKVQYAFGMPTFQYEHSQYPLGQQLQWEIGNSPAFPDCQAPANIMVPTMGAAPIVPSVRGPSRPQDMSASFKPKGNTSGSDKIQKKKRVNKRKAPTVIHKGQECAFAASGTNKCPHLNCRNKKGFKRKEHLKRHLLTVHSTAERRQCRCCNRETFNRKDNYITHLRHHLRGTARTPKHPAAAFWLGFEMSHVKLRKKKTDPVVPNPLPQFMAV
ncbi:hypothetical protein F5Y14DRAFT_450013 [Nemania sp. NC0429]|nr:hypothetical protein F5Y14DRAFT_450013 [Nemania sp. NC0429]